MRDTSSHIIFSIHESSSPKLSLYAPTHDLIAQLPLILTHFHSSPCSKQKQWKKTGWWLSHDLRNMADPFRAAFKSLIILA